MLYLHHLPSIITPQKEITMKELSRKETEVVSGGLPVALIGGIFAALFYGSIGIALTIG